MTQFTLNHPDEIENLVKQLDIPWGSRLGLIGPLGAGKTTFCKSLIAAKLGINPEQVQSPTFGLVHSYSDRIYHMDWYRLENEREVEQLGLDEMLSPTNILLIEWVDKFPQLQQSLCTHLLRFEILDPLKRRLDFIAL